MGNFSYECTHCGYHDQFDWVSKCMITVSKNEDYEESKPKRRKREPKGKKQKEEEEEKGGEEGQLQRDLAKLDALFANGEHQVDLLGTYDGYGKVIVPGYKMNFIPTQFSEYADGWGESFPCNKYYVTVACKPCYFGGDRQQRKQFLKKYQDVDDSEDEEEVEEEAEEEANEEEEEKEEHNEDTKDTKDTKDNNENEEEEETNDIPTLKNMCRDLILTKRISEDLQEEEKDGPVTEFLKEDLFPDALERLRADTAKYGRRHNPQQTNIAYFGASVERPPRDPKIEQKLLERISWLQNYVNYYNKNRGSRLEWSSGKSVLQKRLMLLQEIEHVLLIIADMNNPEMGEYYNNSYYARAIFSGFCMWMD